MHVITQHNNTTITRDAIWVSNRYYKYSESLNSMLIFSRPFPELQLQAQHQPLQVQMSSRVKPTIYLQLHLSLNNRFSTPGHKTTNEAPPSTFWISQSETSALVALGKIPDSSSNQPWVGFQWKAANIQKSGGDGQKTGGVEYLWQLLMYWRSWTFWRLKWYLIRLWNRQRHSYGETGIVDRVLHMPR